jgi:hypothetical protein
MSQWLEILSIQNKINLVALTPKHIVFVCTFGCYFYNMFAKG